MARYFVKEQAEIDQLAADLEAVTARLTELEEEHGGEGGAFEDFEKVNKASVAARLRDLKGLFSRAGDAEAENEAAVVNEWLTLTNNEAE